MTKTIVLTFSDEVYSYLEIRAAMDNKRLKPALEELLAESAMAVKGKYKIAPPVDLIKSTRAYK